MLKGVVVGFDIMTTFRAAACCVVIEIIVAIEVAVVKDSILCVVSVYVDSDSADESAWEPDQ